MEIGKMKHRIEIQEPIEVKDAYGGITTTYTTRRTCWSKITPMTGKEIYKFQKFDMRISHSVKLYYYSALEPSWRIKYGTRYFNIISIINDEEDNKSMSLLCEEVVNA